MSQAVNEYTWQEALAETIIIPGSGMQFIWHPCSVSIAVAPDNYRNVCFASGTPDERNIFAHSNEKIDQILASAHIPDTGWYTHQEWNQMWEQE